MLSELMQTNRGSEAFYAFVCLYCISCLSILWLLFGKRRGVNIYSFSWVGFPQISDQGSEIIIGGAVRHALVCLAYDLIEARAMLLLATPDII